MPAPTEFINYVREQYPDMSARAGDDDERMYVFGKNQGLDTGFSGESRWTEVDGKRQHAGKSYGSYNVTSARENRLDDITRPDKVNGLAAWMDYGINEDSWVVWRQAYNQSLTGMMEQAVTGQARYDVSDYESSIFNDVVAGIASFLMPADILSMFAGGGLGGMAVKGMSKSLLYKGVTNRLGGKIAKETGQTIAGSSLLGGVNMATTLGVYEGARGGAQASIDGENVFGGIATGLLRGGGLGFAAGMTGGGLSALNQITKKSMVKKMTGNVGQVVAEEAVFTGADVKRAIDEGNYDGDFLATAFLTNMGMFGVIKGQQKLFGGGLDAVKKYKKTIFDEAEASEAQKIKDGIDGINESRQEGMSEAELEMQAEMDKEINLYGKNFDDKLAEQKIELDELEINLRKLQLDLKKALSGELTETEFIERNGIETVKALNQVYEIADRLNKQTRKDNQAKGVIEEKTNQWKELRDEISEALDSFNNKNEREVNKRKQDKTDYDNSVKQQFKFWKAKELNKKTSQIKDSELPTRIENIDGKDVKVDDIKSMEAFIEASEKFYGADKSNLLKSIKADIAEVKRMSAGEDALDVFNEVYDTGTKGTDPLEIPLTNTGARASKKNPDRILTSQDGKTVNDVLIESNISDDNKRRIYVSVKRWARAAGLQMPDFKKVLELAEHFEKTKGENTPLDTITKQDILDFFADKKIDQTEKSFNQYMGAFAKFFGGHHAKAKIHHMSQQGFSGQFMKTSPTWGIGWGDVQKGAAVSIDYKQKVEMDKVMDEQLPDDFNLKDETKGLTFPTESGKDAPLTVDSINLTKQYAKDIIGFFYHLPKRSGEILNKLKVQDWDSSTNTLTVTVSGKGGKASRTKKQYIEPGTEIHDIITRNTKGKKGGDLVFGEVLGKNTATSQKNLNALYKFVMAKANIKPTSIRGGKVFTSHNNRHSMLTDAYAIFRETGKDFRDFVDQVMLDHSLAKDSRYHYIDNPLSEAEIRQKTKEFYNARKKIKERTDADVEHGNVRLESGEKKAQGKEQELNIEDTDVGKTEAEILKDEQEKKNINTIPGKVKQVIKSMDKAYKRKQKLKKGQKKKALLEEESSAVEKTSIGDVFKKVDKMKGDKGEAQFLKFLEEAGWDFMEIHAGMKKHGLDGMKESYKLWELNQLVDKKILTETHRIALDNVHFDLNNERTKFQISNPENLRDYEILGKEELKMQHEWVKRVFPHLEVVLRNNLGRVKGNKVLGRIKGHLVEILKDGASIDTLPHEIAHHVVDVLKVAGDKRSKKLIEEGIKQFGGEHELVDALGKYSRHQLKGGLFTKARHWIKKFWFHLKNDLMGNAAANDLRVSKSQTLALLSDKIIKGEVNVSDKRYIETLKTSYKTVGAEKKKWLQEVHHLETKSGVWHNTKRKHELRKQAGWMPDKNGLYGKGSSDRATVEVLQKYYDLLAMDNGKGSPTKSSVSDVNIKYNVSEDFSDFLLRELGVKDGNVDLATQSQIDRYTSVVIRNFEPPLREQMTSHDLVAMLGASDMPKMAATKRSTMSTWDILKNYGGDAGRWIAGRMAKINWLEHTKYKGFGDSMVKKINDTLEKSKYGRKSVDLLWVMDRERSDYLYKNDMLTKEEKYFYERMQKKNTPEAKAVELHTELTNKMWEGLGEEVSAWTGIDTPMFKNWQKQFNKKFINQYFTRRITKEFLEKIETNSPVMDKIAKKWIASEAYKKAIKEGYKPNTEKFKLRVNKHKTSKDFIEKVHQSLFDMMKNPDLSVKNEFLMDRGLKLDEFIEFPDGKKVRVYETKFENTTETYINTMSRYAALVRYLPEYTAIGKQFGLGKTKGKLVSDLRKQQAKEGGAKNTMTAYALAVLERELGLHTSYEGIIKKETMQRVGRLVNLNALAGLSSPTSGIKNVLIQLPRSVAIYGPLNTLKGVARAFDPEMWDIAREKGQVEFGTKQIAREAGSEGQFLKKTTKFVFEANLMAKTETFNRIVTSHAGKLWGESLVGKLRGETRFIASNFKKGQIRNILHETFELEASDVNFMEKTRLDTPEQLVRWDNIMSQIEHYSHVKSAGGTATGLLPLWASSKEGRALTLFQRMAYVTTVDSYKNIVKPLIKYGNPMPLVMGAIGHGLSGQALYGMYDWAFGTEPPKSHGDDFDKAVMYMWRGEFLGVLGEAISPYGGLLQGTLGIGKSERDVSFNPIMEPVIIRNLNEARKNAISWYTGGKTTEQAFMDTINRSVVVIGQASRYAKIKQSQHFKWDKKIKTVRNTFMEDMGYGKAKFGDVVTAESTAFYRDLKDAIYSNSKSDLEKQVWKTYDYLIHEKIQNTGGPYWINKLHDEVISDILRSAKYTSPLEGLSLQDTSLNRTISKRAEFLSYLKAGGQNYETLAVELDKIVQYKIREIQRILKNQGLRNKYSSFPVLTRHNLAELTKQSR